MDEPKSELKFDSIEQLQAMLKDVYIKEGLSGVKNWVTDNLTKGRKILFQKGQTGQLNEEMSICDRKLQTLDKNGVNITNDSFLPLLSETLDYNECKLYFTLRVLFVEEPFGLIIYKKRDS